MAPSAALHPPSKPNRPNSPISWRFQDFCSQVDSDGIMTFTADPSCDLSKDYSNRFYLMLT